MQTRRAVLLAGMAIVSAVAVVWWALAGPPGGDEFTASVIGENEVVLGPPFPGIPTALSEALTVVDYPVPTLATPSIPGRCRAGEVTLTAVWISDPSTDESFRQVGLTYSDGTWVSVTPLSYLAPDALVNRARGRELAPLDQVLSEPPSQHPGVVTDSARNRTAWVRPSTSSPPCEAWLDAASAGTRGLATPGPTAVENAAPLFVGTGTSTIMWVENDVFIDLTGPYALGTLRQLAQDIEWVSHRPRTKAPIELPAFGPACDRMSFNWRSFAGSSDAIAACRSDSPQSRGDK